MKKKAYISGQISGLPYDEVVAKFATAEAKLQAQGYETVNPLNNGIPINAPWEIHVAMDVVLLMGCDTIYLLPDWQQSKGATLEKSFAELTGKTIIYEKEPAFPLIKQAIAEIMGVTFQEITGRKRIKKYVYARMIFAHLCWERGETKVAIARDMQHHHTTVMYYLKTYQDDYKYTPDFREYANDVKKQLSKDNFCA
jgi:hypothetical protein